MGYLIVVVGIVLTLAGTATGVWQAMEGARIGSRSTHEAEEAVFDESVDMEELQSDYVQGMGAQISGLTQVAINMQAAVAPDVSLGSPGLSEGITFGSLATQEYEDAQQDVEELDDGDDAEDADELEDPDDQVSMFQGTIEVELTGAAGNAGQGGVTIVVEEGGVVSGTVTNSWEDASDASGLWKVTQSGAFTGSITIENEITGSGTVRTVAVGSDGTTKTTDMVIVIKANPTDSSLRTWTVIMGPEGGDMSTFTGYVR